MSSASGIFPIACLRARRRHATNHGVRSPPPAFLVMANLLCRKSAACPQAPHAPCARNSPGVAIAIPRNGCMSRKCESPLTRSCAFPSTGTARALKTGCSVSGFGADHRRCWRGSLPTGTRKPFSTTNRNYRAPPGACPPFRVASIKWITQIRRATAAPCARIRAERRPAGRIPRRRPSS